MTDRRTALAALVGLLAHSHPPTGLPRGPLTIDLDHFDPIVVRFEKRAPLEIPARILFDELEKWVMSL